MRDFLEVEYTRKKIEVWYGQQRVGEVHSFLQSERDKGQVDFYVEGIKSMINVQKHCDSANVGFDVGPAIALANSIKQGGYERLLRKMSEERGIALDGVEKVFEVHDMGDVYHILPVNSYSQFRMAEQRGAAIVRAYPVLRASNVADRDKETLEYLLRNRGAFNALLDDRKVSENVEVRSFKGLDEQYGMEHGVLILKNLLERMVSSFSLDFRELEMISPADVRSAYYNAYASSAVAVA